MGKNNSSLNENGFILHSIISELAEEKEEKEYNCAASPSNRK
jgi:hypothetical protein